MPQCPFDYGTAKYINVLLAKNLVRQIYPFSSNYINVNKLTVY